MMQRTQYEITDIKNLLLQILVDPNCWLSFGTGNLPQTPQFIHSSWLHFSPTPEAAAGDLKGLLTPLHLGLSSIAFVCKEMALHFTFRALRYFFVGSIS